MKLTKLLVIPLTVLASVFPSACTSEDDPKPVVSTSTTTFRLGMDTQTRSAQPINFSLYEVKMYLYEERLNEESNSLAYQYKTELEITQADLVVVDDLTPGNKYKAVFLAIPKEQLPSLPIYKTIDVVTPYESAEVQYISEDTNDIENHIYRSIVNFTATTADSEHYTVLTRQNGAVEVRILNTPGVSKAELHLKGHTTMLIQDGTGGQVKTVGQPTEELVNTIEDVSKVSDIRVRINILPQEDISDDTGNSNYLKLTMDDGTEKVYNIKSDHDKIPVYPNQVTWLTIGNNAGNFDVSFSGYINVEDDKWDGWK